MSWWRLYYTKVHLIYIYSIFKVSVWQIHYTFAGLRHPVVPEAVEWSLTFHLCPPLPQLPVFQWEISPCPPWTACRRTSRSSPHSMTPPQSATKTSTNQKMSRWHHCRAPPIGAAPLFEWNVYSRARHKLCSCTECSSVRSI